MLGESSCRERGAHSLTRSRMAELRDLGFRELYSPCGRLFIGDNGSRPKVALDLCQLMNKCGQCFFLLGPCKMVLQNIVSSFEPI